MGACMTEATPKSQPVPAFNRELRKASDQELFDWLDDRDSLNAYQETRIKRELQRRGLTR